MLDKPQGGKPWKAHCYKCIKDQPCETQAEAQQWARDHWDEFGHHADYWAVRSGDKG